MYKVVPTVQDYHWGAQAGENSVVEQPCCRGFAQCKENAKTFAELWLGNHPNGMTSVVIDGEKKPLDQFIADEKLVASTFLLKVLAVRQPLSLQIHPSKEIAEQLHAARPDIYKDDNHKPEMAVALSDEFVCLAGFRSPSEVRDIAGELPIGKELLLGDNLKGSSDEDFLRSSFFRVLTEGCTGEKLKSAIRVIGDMPLDKCKPCTKEAVETFNYCAKYHEDPTLFAVFLLRRVVLKKGEAIFMGPNNLHAYLEGDCVECMAASDNVIRGGLTPKYIDIEALKENLQCLDTDIKGFVVESKDWLTEYRPAVKDFKIVKMSLKKGEEVSLYSGDIIPSSFGLGFVLMGDVQISGQSTFVHLIKNESFIISKPETIRLRANDDSEIWMGCNNIVI